MTPGGGIANPFSNNVSTGNAIFTDSSYEHPMTVATGGSLWSATYAIDKDTPAGNYTVGLSGITVTGGTSGYGGEALADKTATITVTRPKINAVINFEYDYLTVTYGDANFTNSMNGESGPVTFESSDPTVATVDENTGEVTILKSGITTITANAAANEDYNATSASYTLNVNKKAVSISNITIANKVYDGSYGATVNSISFSGLVNGDTFTEDTDYAFGDVFFAETPNVGTDLAVAGSVALIGDAVAKYELTSSWIDTTASITPLTLLSENIALSSTEFTYTGTAIQPTATVTAITHGGITTLTEGQDYTIAYSEDVVNVGDKIATITGIGNFSGEFERAYSVAPYTLTAADVALAYETVRVDGTAKEPAVTVRIGNFVVPSDYYEVSYTNNQGVTTEEHPAVVTVTPTNVNLVSTPVEKTFSIIDKEIITIGGIEDQNIVYTGSPVVLEGALTVSENEYGITANDVMVAWFDRDSISADPIDKPTNVGNYAAFYTVDTPDAVGSLTVLFSITKADSGIPAEATEERMIAAGVTLADGEAFETANLAWSDPTSVVLGGLHTYPATYTKNGDTANYTTTELDIAVFGFDLDNEYGVIEGDEQEAVKGDESGVRFRFDADFTLFTTGGRVYVDEVLIAAANYTAASGRTIITLKPNFVATLANGEHEIAVLFNNGGYAAATFNLTAPAEEEEGEDGAATPDTGIFTSLGNSADGGSSVLAAVIALPAVLTLGAIIYMVTKHKKIDFTK